MIDKKIKDNKISVRLSDKAMKRLEELKKSRGLNITEVVNQSILGVQVINIGDIKELGKEFSYIRTAIEKNDIDENIRLVGERICQYIEDLLLNVENSIM